MAHILIKTFRHEITDEMIIKGKEYCDLQTLVYVELPLKNVERQVREHLDLYQSLFGNRNSR